MPRFRDLADLVTLCRWLDPWADDASAPGVSRAVRTPERLGKAYLYAPRDRTPAGAYLIAPGLHHQEHDDPRLDRFCRALAASGILVLAPFLPDFLRLRLAPGTADHLAAAFDDLERMATSHGLGRPAVFSISFGAIPTVALAAVAHRIREAMAERGDGAAAAVVARLGREGRPIHAWLDDVRARARGASSYRDAKLEREELSAVVEDGAATAERRIAAAAALAGEEEGRSRVRIAAQACADELLRLAIEAATEEEVDAQRIEETLRARHVGPV